MNRIRQSWTNNCFQFFWLSFETTCPAKQGGELSTANSGRKVALPSIIFPPHDNLPQSKTNLHKGRNNNAAFTTNARSMIKQAHKHLRLWPITGNRDGMALPG